MSPKKANTVALEVVHGRVIFQPISPGIIP